MFSGTHIKTFNIITSQPYIPLACHFSKVTSQFGDERIVNITYQYQSLEVVCRGSETQLQVTENYLSHDFFVSSTTLTTLAPAQYFELFKTAFAHTISASSDKK